MNRTLITLVAIVVTVMVASCDDRNKRETPSSIEHTTWQAISYPDLYTRELYVLKFYTTNCDLIFERTYKGVIIQSNVQNGDFTYRTPKVRINLPSTVLQGIVTSTNMLFGNDLYLAQVK